MKSLKVFLIDCCAGDKELLAAELARGGYKLETACTCLDEQFIDGRGNWDIAFCGITAQNAATVLEKLKQKKLVYPLVVLADQSTENIALELMKAGACDYILREDLKRLVPLIDREIARTRFAESPSQTSTLTDPQKKILGSLDFWPDPTCAEDLQGRVIG